MAQFAPQMALRSFVRKGVSIDSEDDYEATPLHHAVKNENCSLEVIKYLLDNGADIRATDEDGQTPLHYLVQKFRKDAIDVACLLLDHGAEIEELDDLGRTPLHHAVGTPSNIDIVKFLLDQGANLLAISSYSRPTLDYAISGADYDILKLLFDLEANVNYLCKNGEQAMHSAGESCNPRLIKLLVNYEAEVNVVDNFNISPLYVCVLRNKRESSKMFLDCGALVSCGKSPLNVAINEYNSSKDDATLSHLQLLLKYTLFENAVLNLEDEYSNSSLPEELIDFRSECLREISRMQSISIENTNLLQFVFQLRQELRHKDKEDINRILNKLLRVIYSNAFPLYNEVIIGLERQYLEDNLKNLLVYAVLNEIDPHF